MSAPPAAPPARRPNDEWLAALRGQGEARRAADRDLRSLLVAGLRRALGPQVDDDTCQDFAQEAMLRIVGQLDTFRGQSRFGTWALAIAVRVAFDELRHRRWKDVSFEALTASAGAGLELPAAAGDDSLAGAPQERTLLRERVLGALRAAIAEQLTERQRRVLAAELQGMPQAEIALALGVNRNALYKLAHDARRKVKAALAAHGLSAGDVLWAFE